MPTAAVSALAFPPVAVDENDTSGPISTPPKFENQVVHHCGSDRERSRKPIVFARCAHGQRGADHEAVGELHCTRHDFLGDQRVCRHREMWAVLLGRSDRDQD